MKWGNVLAGGLIASAGLLVYGALVESNRLVVKRRSLRLLGWPDRLDGFRVVLLADFHLRDAHTVELGRRAIAATLDASPDMVVIVGDFVGYWKPASVAMLGEVLEPLIAMEGNVAAVPGNHDYYGAGDPDHLEVICDALNIRLLRNQLWSHQGIHWLGIDSLNAGDPDPYSPLRGFDGHGPIVALWHEPDLVEVLPKGIALQLSGHSHGGQFLAPWGWAPMSTRNGRRYVRGFYRDAPTPLYVTSGLGTTGPPSRLFCPPEVVVLTLNSV